MKSEVKVSLIALAAIFIALISQHAASPVIYSSDNHTITQLHQDPAALKRISAERSNDLIPLISDILDATGTVVVSIKAKDFETAERDIKEYLERSHRLDSLVINLDMTETELEEFRQNNALNRQSLQDLLNDTRRFDELQRLEIRCKDENRPDLLYSVTYEGEALRAKIGENYQGYSARRDAIVATGDQLGVDTTRYEQSVEDLADIVEEVEKRQEIRRQEVQTILPPRQHLSLSITPDQCVYGDGILIAGDLTGGTPLNDRAVDIFFDSRNWTTTATDANGHYHVGYVIGRVRAGTHLLYAVSGSTYSKVATITVLPLESNLTLKIDDAADSGNITFEGRLTTSEKPVSRAPVQILANGVVVLSTETNLTGHYSASYALSEGTYQVMARFSDTSFPLNASESQSRTVVVASQVPTVPLLVATGAVLLSLTGAVWYVWRRNREAMPLINPDTPADGKDDDETPASEPASESGLSEQEPEDALQAYERLLQDGDLSGATHLLYLSMTERIAARCCLEGHLAMTPREMASACNDRAIGSPLRRFVETYEPIRYAGSIPAEADRTQLVACYRSVLTLLEDESN
jgi:hypothetical protein